MKNYLLLLLKTFSNPNKALSEISEKKNSFHVIYYMSFTFFLGLFLTIFAVINPEAILENSLSPNSLTQSLSLTLISFPLFILIFSLYFDFAQSIIFKLKNMTMNYFKLVLWSFHYFIISLFIFSIAATMVFFEDSEFSAYISITLLLLPIANFIFLVFWSMKVACTKTIYRTIMTFTIGTLVFYMPIYIFS